MKKIFCLLPASLLCYFSFSQKTLPEFGKIDPAELQLKSCSFEPAAGAMNIFKTQEIELKANDFVSKLTIEKRVRIKIFKESGYKYATIRIPYFSKKGVSKIKDLSGAVYNLDSSGNVVIQKLEKKDFFKEKVADNIGMINFTFPNVKPGSVIEFKYTKFERDIWSIDPWIIQDDIPTLYASATIVTPIDAWVKEKIYGADTIRPEKEQLPRSRVKRVYERENIKSFQPEPFMSSYKDNLLKVIFLLLPRGGILFDMLMNTQYVWKTAGEGFLYSSNYGKQIRKTIPGTEQLIDSAKKIASVGGVINFLYKEVRKRLPAKVEQTLDAEDIIDAWNNKSANSTEINLILLNLLEKANVKCYPLLVSTRENGRVSTNFPSPGQFNGLDVVAADYDKVYVLDASLKYQSFRNPPYNIMNREGFLLVPNDMKWIMITDDDPLLKQNTSILATFRDDGSIEGDATLLYYDYAKSAVLDSSDEDEKEDHFFDKMTQGLKIISVKQKDAEDDTEPLTQDIKFSYQPQSSGDFFFINPEFLFLKKDNPFVKDTRNTDVDFGSNQQFTSRLLLTIPATYEVEELPKNMMVRAPDTSFFFKRIFSSDSTHVLLTQTFEIKRSIFDKEDYPAIKEFFTRAYALMQEEIVLKKKK
ncbi:MAG TPA: DUF3857 domain-containing protein [Chitinophagaceae bacterium]|nr:DUF3857 domain-containing protein [Chitinophagaceae bacterium]